MKWAHPARGRTTPIWGRPARWRSAPSADTAQHGAERLLGSGGDGRTPGGLGREQPRRAQAHVLSSGDPRAIAQYGPGVPPGVPRTLLDGVGRDRAEDGQRLAGVVIAPVLDGRVI